MKPAWLKWRWLLAILVMAAALDYNGYRHQATQAEAGDVTDADAVVALTGGSGLRIAAAVGLLEAGVGTRMLISGVNPSVDAQEVAARAGGADALWSCCIDIGYAATTTRGNAQEVAAWAQGQGFDRLVLVTSDYHIPRSLLLLQAASPEVEFVPYPVTTRIDPARAFSDWRSFRGTVVEWLKWRVTQAGRLFS